MEAWTPVADIKKAGDFSVAPLVSEGPELPVEEAIHTQGGASLSTFGLPMQVDAS